MIMEHLNRRRIGVSAAVLFFSLMLVEGVRAANEEIGVVLLHGKWGNPSGTVLNLSRKLVQEGFLVSSPEMPWSGGRLYDRGIDAAMAEIDAAVKLLQGKGARKIFIAGHSLGAAAVVRYGTRPTPSAGFILLAPGHFPEGQVFRNQLAGSLRKAEAMVQEGKGDDKAQFDDLNTGNRAKSVRTTARIYLDYFGSDGPLNFQRNIDALKPGVPILWVVGTEEEKGLRTFGDRGRARIPANPGNRFIEVSAGHLETPDRSVEAVSAWIRDMAR
jgi:pimeloyl-ACP methyl ester carboxylesterase